MSECFAAAQGEYSDYMIHAVFEREEDANEYVLLANLREARGYHDRYRTNTQPIRSGWTADEVAKHQADFEDCDACKLRMTDHYTSLFVERFAFYPAGEVPHRDAAPLTEEKK